jgi:hypothetical protein
MTHENLARPEFITDDMLQYLDNLRESGAVNMFGAITYLLEDFPEMSKSEARNTLTYWMETFGKEDR